jgi:ABC-type Zn uptake system ZnuABC Zn-binding protein ZnuA
MARRHTTARVRALLGSLALVGVLATGPAVPQPEDPQSASALAPTLTVLTGMQATYSLSVALTAGTPIEVVNVPPDGRAFALLKDYIERREGALAPTFAAATAAVTLTNALPGDPLYRYAREANIRIVDIDAAVPWALDRPGVALADSPASNVSWGKDTETATTVTAPYFWLSISNVIRMADLIAHDLAAIFPESAPAIGANLDALKRSLLALRNEYHDRLLASGDDVVFSLTADFVYLTNDLGLFVDGYFLKQDVRWTEDDLANLTRHLRERDIEVVIHRWQPSESIQNAVRAAGATLVVLDPGDPGIVVDGALAVDGLQQILRNDLEALAAAFAR